MKTVNVSFVNENDKQQFVNKCEQSFESRLSKASLQAVNSDANIVLLSGPTCAGKTTTANKLIDDFYNANKEVLIISIDDFFYERSEGRVVQDNVKLDYDSVDVLDLNLLTSCIEEIKVGNTISVPKFDFLTQRRTSYTKHTINDNTVVIFEGIQAVYPEVVSLIKVPYIGIFINVEEDICVNGVHFSNNEIRLVRRLVRDRKFRGASADFTFFLWETVRENEEKNILPNSDVCTIQIDSFMEYELFLMKDYIIDVLSEVNEESKYYNSAQELIKRFINLERISYEYIPKDSLYTEFLGKK